MFDLLAHKMKWKSFENSSSSDFFFGKKIGKISHCGMRERGQWVGELLYYSI